MVYCAYLDPDLIAEEVFREGLSEWYSLHPMYQFPKKGKPLKNDIFLELNDNKLKYKILGLEHEIIEEILDIQINEKELTPEILRKLRLQILEKTTEKGHTRFGDLRGEEIKKAFEQLTLFSLIKKKQEGLFSIHRLLQLVIKNEQAKTETTENNMIDLVKIFASFNIRKKISLKEIINKTSKKELLEIYNDLENARLNLETICRYCLIFDFSENQNLLKNHIHLEGKGSKLGYKFLGNDNTSVQGVLDIQINEERFTPSELSKLRPQILDKIEIEIQKKDKTPLIRNYFSIKDTCDVVKKEIFKSKDYLPDQAEKLFRKELEEDGISINDMDFQKIFQLISPDTQIKDRLEITKFILGIDDSERDGFVELIKKLTTPDMRGNVLVSLIMALAKIQSSQRQPLIDSAKQLITDDMWEMERVSIIEALAKIKSSQHQVVIDSAKQLIKPDMTAMTRVSIITALADIESSQRQAVSDSAKQLIMPDMEGEERVSIITALRKIKSSQRQAVSDSAKQLITQYLWGDTLGSIIGALAKIESSQRQPLIDSAKQLIALDMDGYAQASIITALGKTEPNQRQPVIDSAKQLIASNMDGYAQASIITALGKTEPNQRQPVIDSAKQLITPYVDGYALGSIIGSLAKIEFSQRQAVSNSAKQLITPDMDGYALGSIIGSLAKIESSQRQGVADSAKLLLVPDAGNPMYMDVWKNVGSIIEALGMIDDTQRKEFVRKVKTSNSSIPLYFTNIIKKPETFAISQYQQNREKIAPLTAVDIGKNIKSSAELSSQASGQRTSAFINKETNTDEQCEPQKIEEISFATDQNVPNNMPEVDPLQPSQFANLHIPLRADTEGLLIKNKPINVDGGPQEVYDIDSKRFRRQNVSGDSMQCFFNAVGLESDIEIAKLNSKQNDPIIRYMIANEIVSAAANPEQLPKSVKDAINYDLYALQRNELDKLEEKRSNILTSQSPDVNQQNPKALSQIFQEIGERGEDILKDLRKRSLPLSAFRAFLKDHIGSEQMMVALHDVQGDGSGNLNSNYTSIDAVAYVNNLGLKIYQPNEKNDGLNLVHQFIPQEATEIVYLYHQGSHFQALVLG